MCDINIYDFANTYINLFYETSNNTIKLCNYDIFDPTYNLQLSANKKFKIPFFIPLDMLYPNNYDSTLSGIKNYLINDKDFYDIYNFLQNKQQCCVNLLL